MVYPLSDFYKIKHGVGCPRSVPSRQISPLSLLRCGLTAPKIAKVGNFGNKFAQNGYTPLSNFLKQNLAWWRESQVCIFVPNFTILALKMCAYSRKNRNCWYKFAPVEKFWWSTKKLIIGSQVQIFLHAMTP